MCRVHVCIFSGCFAFTVKKAAARGKGLDGDSRNRRLSVFSLSQTRVYATFTLGQSCKVTKLLSTNTFFLLSTTPLNPVSTALLYLESF